VFNPHDATGMEQFVRPRLSCFGQGRRILERNVCEIVSLMPVFTTGVVRLEIILFTLRHDSRGVVAHVENFGDVFVEASAKEDGISVKRDAEVALSVATADSIA
jgi:hypothetical protein